MSETSVNTQDPKEMIHSFVGKQILNRSFHICIFIPLTSRKVWGQQNEGKKGEILLDFVFIANLFLSWVMYFFKDGTGENCTEIIQRLQFGNNGSEKLSSWQSICTDCLNSYYFMDNSKIDTGSHSCPRIYDTVQHQVMSNKCFQSFLNATQCNCPWKAFQIADNTDKDVCAKI